ncbi:MAG: orotate phosphoribosyltransferase [Thermoplasmata archaeon]
MSLVEALKSCGAVKSGDFTLASGRKSHYYVDIKLAVTRPEILRTIVKDMLPHTADCSRIAGTELGAIPLAVALSLESSLPYVMIRREAKAHGTRKPLEGELSSGDRVLLVEDVTTTGATLTRAVEVLRERGAVVEKALCVVDREEGAEERLRGVEVELIPLVRARDLMDRADE